jgi:hypothetical protein
LTPSDQWPAGCQDGDNQRLMCRRQLGPAQEVCVATIARPVCCRGTSVHGRVVRGSRYRRRWHARGLRRRYLEHVALEFAARRGGSTILEIGAGFTADAEEAKV